MHRTIYVTALIALTVTMAASLTAFAIAFDSYVLDHETPLVEANIDDAISDVKNGEVWNSIVTEIQQLNDGY